MTNDSTTPAANQTTYRPHARYVLITAIAALSIPALIWLLLRGIDLAGVLFLIFAVGLLFFAGIDKARFRKPVVPGDQLIFTLKMIKQKRGITIMSATATVDGQVVCEAELMASFS